MQPILKPASKRGWGVFDTKEDKFVDGATRATPELAQKNADNLNKSDEAMKEEQTRAPRPRDPLALAKLVGDIATGQTKDKAPEDGKNANAANLGRLGGAARARALTPEKRKELAQRAAAKRWGKS